MKNYVKPLTNLSKSEVKLYIPLTQLASEHRMPPIISIIVPVYNQENLIKRCLDSIFSQNITNFEVILVDDASTDLTSQVCYDYAKKEKHLQVYTNSTNKGQGFSRNFALTKAKGKYIAFIDSDDIYEKGILQQAVTSLESMFDVDIFHFNSEEKSTTNEHISWKKVPKSTQSGIETFQQFCTGKLPSYVVWDKVYRKKFLEKFSVTFPEYLWEDALFLLKAYYNANKIYFSGEHGYTRFQTPHPASAMNPTSLTQYHISSLCELIRDTQFFFNTIGAEKYKECLEGKNKNLLKRFKSFLPDMLPQSNKKFISLSSLEIQNISFSSCFLKLLTDEYILLSTQSIPVYICKNNKNEAVITQHDSEFRVIKIQNELLRIEKENSPYYQFGVVLLDGFTSFKSFLSLPSNFYLQWKKFYATDIKKYEKNKFLDDFIEIYNTQGEEGIHSFLEETKISASLRASMLTKLARHLESKNNPYKCKYFAFLAYEAEPKPFRLKWLMLKAFKVNDVWTAKAALNILPQNIPKSESEKNIINRIKLKSI